MFCFLVFIGIFSKYLLCEVFARLAMEELPVSRNLEESLYHVMQRM